MSPCLSVLSVQQRQQLEGVVYSSRFALALFFSPDAVVKVPWGAKYVTDSSCIRYVAVDSKKRGAGVSVVCLLPCMFLSPVSRSLLLSTCSDAPGRGPSLVVHTSVPFGLEHLERDKEDVQPVILRELHRLLPGLPQPISIKCQKWRYSQVSHLFVVT